MSFSTSSGTVQGTGAGQTIAIVDAYNDPNIVADLKVFDAEFGLAAAAEFQGRQPERVPRRFPAPMRDGRWRSRWTLNGARHRPGANILLVEANSSNLTDLLSR